MYLCTEAEFLYHLKQTQASPSHNDCSSFFNIIHLKNYTLLFSELNLIAPILKALETEGYTQPTPIQEQSIPSILQKRDLLGCAQTGTGKTAAFAIPMLQLLDKPHSNLKGPKPIRALILTPTRELAIQIEESFKAYGRNLSLKHLVIFGGVGQKAQTDALHRGVDILVATPGRLLDLMNQGFVNLRDIEIFVLDEADRMLDMGFIHDVKKVIAKLPAKRQTLFFSATMPSEIQKLSTTILTNPVKVEVTPVSSTAEKIQQEVYYVEKNDKRSLLAHLLKDKTIETVLVFTRTKHGADKVVKDLIKINIKAEAIHGNKSQNARQRALTNFKARTTRVLVATDIAARGIDVDELAHVINYELPNIPETYVHRIGRTGRAGLSGIAYSFCDGEEKEFLDDIEKLIGLKIPVNEEHPFAMSWQSLMSAAAAAKSGGKKKGNQREPREREPNLSGAKKKPQGGGARKPNHAGSTASANAGGGNRRFSGGGSRRRD